MLPRALMFLAGVVVIALGAAALIINAEAEERTSTPPNTKQLLERIEKLESRVAELEKHQRVMVVPLERTGSVPGGQVPKAWTEKEFNGMRYYIVPCDKEKQAVTSGHSLLNRP